MNSSVSFQSGEDFDPFEGYEPIKSWADYMDKAEAEGYIDPRPLKIPHWAVLDFPGLSEDLMNSPGVLVTGQDTRVSRTWHGVSEEKKSKRQRNRKPFAQNRTWGRQEMPSYPPTRSAPASAPQCKHPDSQSSFKAAGPPQRNPPASKPPPDVSTFEFKLPPTFVFAQNKTGDGQEMPTIPPTTSAPAPAPQNQTPTVFQRDYWTFPERPMSAVFGSAKRQAEPDTSCDELCRLLEGLQLNTEAPTTSTPAPAAQRNPPASKPPPDVSKFEFKLPSTFVFAQNTLWGGQEVPTIPPTTSVPAPQPPASKPPPDVSKFEFKLPSTFVFAQNKTGDGQEMPTIPPTTSAPAPAPQNHTPTVFLRDYWTFPERPMSAVFGSAKRQAEPDTSCDELCRLLEGLQLNTEAPTTSTPAPAAQPPFSMPPPFEFGLPPNFAFAQNTLWDGQEMPTIPPTTSAPAPLPQSPASKPPPDVSKFEFKLPSTFVFAQNTLWGGQEMPTIPPTTSAPAPLPQPPFSMPPPFEFGLPPNFAFAQNTLWGGQEMPTIPPTTSVPAPQPSASKPPPDFSNFEVRFPLTFGYGERQQKPDTSFKESCRVLDTIPPITSRPVAQRYHHHLRRFRKQDPSYKAAGPPQCNPPPPDVSNFELKWRRTFENKTGNKTGGGQEMPTKPSTTTASNPAPQSNPPASKPPADMSNFEVKLPPTPGSAKRQRKPDTSFDELCRVLDGLGHTKPPATSRPVAQRYHPYLLPSRKQDPSFKAAGPPQRTYPYSRSSRKQDPSSKTAGPPQSDPPASKPPADMSNFEVKLPPTPGSAKRQRKPDTSFDELCRVLDGLGHTKPPATSRPVAQRYHPYLLPSRKQDPCFKAAGPPQRTYPYSRSSRKQDPSFKTADPPQCDPPLPDVSNFELKLPPIFEFAQNKTLGAQEMPTNPPTTTAPAPVPRRSHPFSRSLRNQEPSVKAAYQPQRYHPYMRPSRKQGRS